MVTGTVLCIRCDYVLQIRSFLVFRISFVFCFETSLIISVFVDKSDLVEGPVTETGAADDLGALDAFVVPEAGVIAVAAVISHHEVAVLGYGVGAEIVI